jgi:radical SAM superfamily enzyme YgiQ (UPF0313 family)
LEFAYRNAAPVGRTVITTASVHRSGNWVLSAKRHSTSISPDRDTVYSFDLEGRPLYWFERGRTYKRSLASVVHARDRENGRRRRRRLSAEEAAQQFAAMLRIADRAPLRYAGPVLHERLMRIRVWSPDALHEERAKFDNAYRPISILPPDQYLGVVVQATFGCSWNRCTFCNFYQDETFRARTPSAFEEHCRAVRRLLGNGDALRRSIFLASGNALVLANDRLRPLFDAAREQFPGRPLAGFVDVFTGARKSAEAWSELAERGLSRVHVGLETGHDPLLRWLNKPGSADQSGDFVRTLKRAGLHVSVIVMVGVGGAHYADDHVRDTLALVAALPLTRGDTVYLSPFLEQPDSEYARRAAEDGMRPLDEDEIEVQYDMLRDAIRRAHPSVTVSRYDIREFVY